jgi:putative membrane protein
MMEAGHNASNRLSQQRTDLAVTRTVMAADRTLMAWTRTSLAMISFGFTVYKFMQYMQEEGRAVLARTERGAQNFGLTLIAVGILSLLIACVQYWHLTKKIDPGRKWHFSLTVAVAGFVVALGLGALVNAIFKIGPF